MKDNRRSEQDRRALAEARRLQREAQLANQRIAEAVRAPPPPPPRPAAAPAAQAADPKRQAIEARRMREEALRANQRNIQNAAVVRRPGQRPVNSFGRPRSPYTKEPSLDDKMTFLFGQGPGPVKEGRQKIRDRARRQG